MIYPKQKKILDTKSRIFYRSEAFRKFLSKIFRFKQEIFNSRKNSTSLFFEKVRVLSEKILDVTLKKSKVYSIPNVVYAREDHNQTLLMNLLQPVSSTPTPAVIFATGGGFVSTDQSRFIQPRMFLAEHGFFVASISYRVMPRGKFPAPVEDLKSAIRFLKAHAKDCNIDPEKISLVGTSAGGFLAAFCAVTNDSNKFDRGLNLDQSSKIRSVVDIYGVSDLKLFDVDKFPDARGFVTEDNIDEADLTKYVSKNAAPMLLFHGLADEIVPPVHANNLYKALSEAGATVEKYLIPNANHADAYFVQDEVCELMLEFLNRYGV